MQNIKSHKTVEQIAKKHRLDVSFVKKQLEMGIPIEHEHTKDKDLATDIALQHLDEIPDYYTRLKKMEASARKSHKKYKDVSEGKKGLWDNIHAGREKGLPPKKPGEKGYPKTLDIKEGIKQARKNVGASKCWTGKKLGNPPTKMKGGKEVPNCVAKEELSSGLNYDWDTPIRERPDRYCPKCEKLETRSECKYGPRYWDMFSIPAEIISSKKDYNVTMPHPGNFPESYDHEYSMARSEISTIISAAKRLKKKMKGEGNIEAWVQSKITKAADYLDAAADYVDSGEMKEESESLVLQDLNGNDFVEIIDVIKPHPIRVKKEQFSNWRKELSEDWQSANRKDRTDGMSRETVKKYRDENPGSKLQTAVTEKNPTGERADRQDAFCRRMNGMKERLTSKKTARDPDSRINKALRRWRCR